MIPTFEAQVEAWSRPPVDDIGYLPSAELLELSDENLRKLVLDFEHRRYHGWRNYRNRWRELFALDSTRDCVVLDYGCGVGVEALQYAYKGNRVILADIAPNNLLLAHRVLSLFGYGADTWLLSERPSGKPVSIEVDVIHCAGVLHHIPNAVEVVEAWRGWLADDGEVRLMLYSDVAFLHYGDGFLRSMDEVGGYADWYDIPRIEDRFGEWFKIKRHKYLTETRHYIGVVLEKR